jgi:phosphate starvation-inducible PhoH-like protein
MPEKGLEVLFGPYDQNIKYLESLLSVRVGGRGNELLVEGDEADVAVVERILKDFTQLFVEGRSPSSSEMRNAFRQISDDRTSSLRELLTGQKQINPSGRKQVMAKGPNQSRYLEAIEKNDIVFGIGPAGTGKTFLAVAMALQFLLAKRVNRIILARPAVEAGEKLGFLPGDLQEKVDPYLRPLYDSLFDLIESEKATRLLEKRVIEVAPLAFMRGRTLSDSFIILDEAQNTTSEQMKMFLTRIGFGSKAVITGDVTQIDLPSGRKSGLVEAQRVVSGIEGIVFVQFDDRDVVRHHLVQMIVKAYDEQNRKISL